MQLSEFYKNSAGLKSSPRMPVFFIGHGSPMNGIAHNDFTEALAKMAANLEFKPAAILVVSAHWLTHGTHVLTSQTPRTIYDFHGFPEPLYKVHYNAPGSPEFAEETRKMALNVNILENDHWGFDHGTWTILRHMFPEALIPVYQLSIDYDKPARYHFELAKELSGLRDKGVLVIGSGNIVHNLYKIDFNEQTRPYDWAQEFDLQIKTALERRNFDDLINYKSFGEAAKLSVPSTDHYLPMMYTLGLMDSRDSLNFTFEGMQHASISMRCFRGGG